MKNCFLIITLLCFSLYANAQFRISGYIKDAKTAKNLIGANIWQPGSKNGTANNFQWFYRYKITGDRAAIET